VIFALPRLRSFFGFDESVIELPCPDSSPAFSI
jgi:hypothetical protein